MFRKITNLMLMLLLGATAAIAQIDLPQPSPSGSVSSRVGLTDITIDYFRPKVKGRKIFGANDALQPYGQIWRTGANSGTVLTLSTEATIAGTKVEAGEYLIFSIPGADSWTVMLYSDLSLGGNVNGYKEENEVMRATVKPTKLSDPVETLAFQITDISEDNTSANIRMAWSDVAINVPVEVSFVDKVMSEIKEKTQVNPVNYLQGANFYLSQGQNLDVALDWINKYLAEGENGRQFWNVHTKARILAEMGNKKQAIATAKDSMEMAKNNPNGDFGYVKRNEDLIASLK